MNKKHSFTFKIASSLHCMFASTWITFYHLRWLGVTSPWAAFPFPTFYNIFCHTSTTSKPFSAKNTGNTLRWPRLLGIALMHWWLDRDSFVLCDSCCYCIYLTTNAHDGHCNNNLCGKNTNETRKMWQATKNLQVTQWKKKPKSANSKWNWQHWQ